MDVPGRWLGVDCGESRHHLVLLSAEGELEWSRSVENQRGPLEATLQDLLSRLPSGVRVRMVVEGLYGFATRVVEIARDLGLEIWQANPKALKHYRDLEGQPRKDDPRDAFLLARLGYGKMQGCRLAIALDPAQEQLRRLSRLHTRLTQQRGDVLRQLRSRLLELCPEVTQKGWAGPCWSSEGFLAILRRWPGLEGLERARRSTIERILKCGRVGPEQITKQTRALQAMATQLPQSELREILSLELSCGVRHLDTLAQSLKSVDQKIQARVQAHPIGRKLQAMPGVGPWTAAVLVGELLPLAETLPEAKVATYAGLTPLARRSGRSGKNVLARGVNKQALHACYMSAVAVRRVSALDQAYYRKQHSRHQGHPVPHVVANLALARQRMKVFYKLMTTEASYDKEILITSHLRRTEISTICGKLTPSPSPAPTSPPAEGMENHPLTPGFPHPQPTTTTILRNGGQTP